MRFKLLIGIGLIAFGCKSTPEPNDASEQEAIHTLLEGYYQTMSERNWPRYATYFSDDATLTTIWQAEGDSEPSLMTHTITEFLSQTSAGPDSQPIFEERMTHADITVRQDLAQAWVTYEAKFGTEENLMQWKGIDLFSFIRFEGKWKIVSLVFEGEQSGK